MSGPKSGTAPEQTQMDNSQILAEIERGNAFMAQQALTIEKLEAKLKRPLNGNVGEGGGSGVQTTHAKPRISQFDRSDPDVKAFNKFFREPGVGTFESKALDVTTSGDGGAAVPTVIDSIIESLLFQYNPLRKVFKVVPITTNASKYHKLINVLGWTTGWVGEQAARTATGTATLLDLVATDGQIYANPQATQTMIDDVFFDAAQWVVDQIGLSFAEQESIAFLTGTGVNMPVGLLTMPTAATSDATRAFGTAEYVPSGAASTLLSTDPLTALQTLFYKLRPGYRQNAQWLMNPATLAALASAKDTLGRFLIQPSIMLGQPQTLLGKEIVECEAMPQIAANALAIALVDGERCYEIIDRFGIRVLRDPFSNKPFIGFYCTKRVSGMPVNSQAVKFLKIAVS